MRLVIHLGLHKTGSTWLQHLLNRNQPALAARGIWYSPQPGYPAHHHAAWRLLVGDTAPLGTMIAEARAADCQTLILSSEDLESVLVHSDLASAIEDCAAAAGATKVEWHAVLRDPGCCFESLYAQLQYHLFADPLEMFAEVMRRGVLFRPDPMPGENAAPFWFYCFDHAPLLERFVAARPGRRLFAHDYRDHDPFPGWRMLAGLGALDALTDQPDEHDRNRRLDPVAVANGYRARLAEAIDDPRLGQFVAPAIEAHLAVAAAGIERLAAAISHRFTPSHQAALAAHASNPPLAATG